MKRFSALAITALCISGHPLSAQSDATQEADVARFEQMLLGSFMRNRTFDEALPGIRMQFRRVDLDGEPGLTERDTEIAISIQNADYRARALQQLLAYDLNGDSLVTRDEVRLRILSQVNQPLRANGVEVQPTPEQIEQIARPQIARVLRNDTDLDGALSMDEMMTAADAEAAQAGQRRGAMMLPPIAAYDANDDGRLTEDEYLTAIRRVFDDGDADGDGMLSNEEFRDLQQRQADAIRARTIQDRQVTRMATTPNASFDAARAACKMPEVKTDHAVYVVGGYEGAAMSTVSLGSPDTVAEALDLSVPAEGPPITLVAPFFDATVIRLDDPSGRVRQVIQTRGTVALAGAADSVVFTRTDKACHLHLYDRIGPDNPDPAAFYGKMLDRPVTAVIGAYTLGRVGFDRMANDVDAPLPGAVTPDEAVAATEAWAQFMRFNPGGLVPIDPETVQADVDIATHAVWPQQAGVARLVAEGALVPLPRQNIKREILESDAGEVRIGDKTFVPGTGDDLIVMGGLHYTEEREKTWVGRRPLVYLVTRKVMLPQGLGGAHSLNIVVPEGTPVPDGVGRGVKMQMIDDASPLLRRNP